ncbi:response regulator transcription factor [Zeimonas arvi]|uniref:Response regulator transcription factor n=1 Tax=Zeimonas arvi TaxID=2498847 RepID=A0A5C8P002_9BURK|nr:response regulator transcription factor [Zeimonas arvi]
MLADQAAANTRPEGSSPVWRVLIIEDDIATREFFAASVSRCAQLELIAAVGTVAEAAAVLGGPAERIDVMLVDLGLPDGHGLDLIGMARTLRPECEALVVSMFGDDENILSSIEAGALGYIHKDAPREDIAKTIVEMKSGASPISPMIARRVLTRLSSPPGTPAPAVPGLSNADPPARRGAAETSLALTPRERDVLELIARGFSYAEIGRLQAVTVHTIQTHIKSLYRKLAVHSKSEAIYEATRMGLLDVDRRDV